MSARRRGQEESFVARSIRVYRANVAGGFRRANQWRRASVEWVEVKLIDLARWQGAHKVGLIVWLGVVIWLGLTGWFVADWSRGKIEGNVVQTGVGGLIGGAVLGLVVSALAALLAFVAILVVNQVFRLLTPLVLFLPLLLWMPLHALWQSILVAGKVLLLVPLSVLFVASRALELWRGIFYTCPSRECAYRALPTYVCSHCGEGNRRLWPNLYGLLWHHCVRCDRRLPTLDVVGRRRLDRRCGGCDVPLTGLHAGRARERLVAVVGGPGSGKTNYLLMAVNQVCGGSHDGEARLRGEIDDRAQQAEFEREWEQLRRGVPAAKTAEVARAFLLYASLAKAKFQLYLYDAPGEEFSSVASMTKQQYFHLLEGFILLVDPLGFESMRSKIGSSDGAVVSLEDVVTSTLVTAASGAPAGRSGKLRPRVAVVVSKADVDPVVTEIGDVRRERVQGLRCRDAIMRWGGENALRAIEHRFESVEYFACSPLGRAVATERGRAFEGSGVLAPLAWILSARSDRG